MFIKNWFLYFLLLWIHIVVTTQLNINFCLLLRHHSNVCTVPVCYYLILYSVVFVLTSNIHNLTFDHEWRVLTLLHSPAVRLETQCLPFIFRWKILEIKWVKNWLTLNLLTRLPGGLRRRTRTGPCQRSLTGGSTLCSVVDENVRNVNTN